MSGSQVAQPSWDRSTQPLICVPSDENSPVKRWANVGSSFQ